MASALAAGAAGLEGSSQAQPRESWSHWLGRHKVRILVGAAIVGVVLLTGGLALPAIFGVAAIGAIFTAKVIATTVGIVGATMAGAGALTLLVTAIVAYITRKRPEKPAEPSLAELEIVSIVSILSRPFTRKESNSQGYTKKEDLFEARLRKINRKISRRYTLEDEAGNISISSFNEKVHRYTIYERNRNHSARGLVEFKKGNKITVVLFQGNPKK